MKPAPRNLVALLLSSGTLAATLAAEPPILSPYRRWANGPSPAADFFPQAVWLQSPANAERYRRAGINTYVALWKGPTEEQLAALRQAGMKLICEENGVARRHLDDPTIIGWMHGDEPDNAQSLGQGKGYGPPITPEKIIADYQRLRAADPTRPVMLNLGQGVAWDNWIGRGVRRNHPEDYLEYVKGGDIISFDIYPAVHDNQEVAGKLWYVPRGVERLGQWCRNGQIVWNCLECTRIGNAQRKPTPSQVRAEAWMALIHGSRGFIYFVHQFKPVFREAALLDDPDMLAAVTALNRQITELAPVLNSPTRPDVATVKTDSAEAPLALMAKQHEGSTYLFAVAMRELATTATFTLTKAPGPSTVEVLGENRTLPLDHGVFTDHLDPWGVRLYRFQAGTPPASAPARQPNTTR